MNLSGRRHRRGPRLGASVRGGDHRIAAGARCCRSSPPCRSSSPRSAGTTGRASSRPSAGGLAMALALNLAAGLAFALGIGAAGLVALPISPARPPVADGTTEWYPLGRAAGLDRRRPRRSSPSSASSRSAAAATRPIAGACAQRSAELAARAAGTLAAGCAAERTRRSRRVRPRCRPSSRA